MDFPARSTPSFEYQARHAAPRGEHTHGGNLSRRDVDEAGRTGGASDVELPVESPGPGQLRVRVRATGVGATDLIVLAGKYRYAPKLPLVPGYEVAGVVEALGDGVTGFKVGDRVAALTVYGGFADLVTRGAEHFLPIPDDVSDRDVAAVILNYGTAGQMIHRVAKVKRGETALVTGASGGVAQPPCNYCGWRE